MLSVKLEDIGGETARVVRAQGDRFVSIGRRNEKAEGGASVVTLLCYYSYSVFERGALRLARLLLAPLLGELGNHHDRGCASSFKRAVVLECETGSSSRSELLRL